MRTFVWMPFCKLNRFQKAALYQYMVVEGDFSDTEDDGEVRSLEYRVQRVKAVRVIKTLDHWGWPWKPPLGDTLAERRIAKARRLHRQGKVWPYIAGGGECFETWSQDEHNHGDGYHRMVARIRHNLPVDFLFSR